MSKKFLNGIIAALAVSVSSSAFAGPFILAGTDADDHGSATATANVDGWLFMQRALENIAPGVTNGKKVVVSLGSSNTALQAAQSAFNFSSLAGSGWTFKSIDGASAISAYLAGGATTAGIIMLDSGEDNIFGGLSASEQTALANNASAINNFVGGGGGLFSQANDYGWLSAIIDGIGVTEDMDTGIALTEAGSSAFPGLTDDDLSAGPFHEAFENYGSLPVLGVSMATGSAIIVGAGAGSISQPSQQVPEPATLALVLGGAGLLGAVRRKQKRG